MALSPAEAAILSTPAQGSFPTSNTDLGACLGALGVPIQRWRRIREAGSNQTTTFHTFADGDASGNVKCSTYEWAWRHREEFERSNPKHPFSAMRAAIDAMHWIISVHYGKIRFRPMALPAGDFFTTDDWILAACLKAYDRRVADFRGGVLTFTMLRDDSSLERIRAEYDAWTERKSAIQWMRAGLEVRATLIEKTKPGGGLRTETHFVRGDPLNGGKELYLFEEPAAGENLADFEANRRILLTEFHKS